MESSDTANAPFSSTNWSLVAAAGDSLHPDSARALEALCRAYWQPVYGFIRRNVSNVDDARDLTQGFFEHLLENRTLTRADPQQGRFRSFLLGAVKYFLADQRDRCAAIKRGGRIEFLQFDTSMAETRSAAPAQDRSVEAQFDRDWVLAVLDRALHRLREEFTLSGRAELYENLKCVLMGEKSTTYAQIAQRLKITEGAAKMTVKRMRERFGAIIRQEISQTVATPEDLQFELRTFIEALA